MASTLLEITRVSHEEVERFERLIVKLLLKKSESNSLITNHRIRNMLNSVTSATQKLIEIYQDNDNSRKDEIAAFGGNIPNVFHAFYDALKQIHECHKRYGTNSVVAAPIEQEEEEEKLLNSDPDVKFSGEECGGRYLDLHELHHIYINSKFFGKHIEYSDYLDVFSQPCEIPPGNVKFARSYMDYLARLLEYLTDFYTRIEPLQDIDLILSKLEIEFEKDWENKRTQENLLPKSVIDIDYYTTVEELMEVGANKLKEALAGLGLKVGGTIKQRAQRLFLTKNTPLDLLDKKHFSKELKGASSKQPDHSKQMSLMESKLKKMCELMCKNIVHTKENVERKQALTYEELRAEVGEEETQAGSESDDEEEQEFYNPLELPLGFDGKPIPYWMYKLHGLNHTFKCEICGDHIYRGRREFEKHFKESRHQYGMHRLGIPNSKNFYEITSIEEAKALWAKIQEVQGKKRWRPDDDEENEDDEGNVYSKKMYTDLKRQRII